MGPARCNESSQAKTIVMKGLLIINAKVPIGEKIRDAGSDRLDSCRKLEIALVWSIKELLIKCTSRSERLSNMWIEAIGHDMIESRLTANMC